MPAGGQRCSHLPYDGGAHEPAPDALLSALTGREREVLGLLGLGMSNQDIANRLGIGAGTVKTHMAAILDTTHTSSRVQAALLAHQSGLLR